MQIWASVNHHWFLIIYSLPDVSTINSDIIKALHGFVYEWCPVADKRQEITSRSHGNVTLWWPWGDGFIVSGSPMTECLSSVDLHETNWLLNEFMEFSLVFNIRFSSIICEGGIRSSRWIWLFSVSFLVQKQWLLDVFHYYKQHGQCSFSSTRSTALNPLLKLSHKLRDVCFWIKFNYISTTYYRF